LGTFEPRGQPVVFPTPSAPPDRRKTEDTVVTWSSAP